ncbi:TPA: cupin domain-containing protein [Clostridioides difficile]|nr:cupin [Clostridioides difficile]
MKAINLVKEVNVLENLYVYKKVGYLNSHVLSVVQVENRTLDFHTHEFSDELFFVIEGSFNLETEAGKTKVKAGEFIIVPKGMKHRPVVEKLTKFLMIELEGTLNKENSGDLYED